MLKRDFDDFEANGKAGDWCFVSTSAGLHIAIQLTDDKSIGMCMLPVRTDLDQPNPKKAQWLWNGSRETPTLTPSILHWGNGRNRPATWHGYLTDGKLVKV